jgi:hypothetical protein
MESTPVEIKNDEEDLEGSDAFIKQVISSGSTLIAGFGLGIFYLVPGEGWYYAFISDWQSPSHAWD